jgi:hypothetical protein
MKDALKCEIAFPGSLSMIIEAYQELGKPARVSTVSARFPDCFDFSEKRPHARHYCPQCDVLLVHAQTEICTTIMCVDKNGAPVKFRLNRRVHACEMCETLYVLHSASVNPRYAYHTDFALLEPLPFAIRGMETSLKKLAALTNFKEPLLDFCNEEHFEEPEAPQFEIDDWQDDAPLLFAKSQPPVNNHKSVPFPTDWPTAQEAKESRVSQFLDKAYTLPVTYDLLLELNSKRNLTTVNRGKSVFEYKFRDEAGPTPESQECPFCKSKSVKRGYTQSKFNAPRITITIDALDRRSRKIRFLFEVSTFICKDCGKYFHETLDCIPHSFDCYIKYKITEPLSFVVPAVPTAEELVPYADPDGRATDQAANSAPYLLNGNRLAKKKSVLDPIDRSIFLALWDKCMNTPKKVYGKTIGYNFGTPYEKSEVPPCPECKSKDTEKGYLKTTKSHFVSKEIHGTLASKDKVSFTFGLPIYHCKACDIAFSEKFGPLRPDNVYDRYFRIEGELKIEPYQDLTRELLEGLQLED